MGRSRSARNSLASSGVEWSGQQRNDGKRCSMLMSKRVASHSELVGVSHDSLSPAIVHRRWIHSTKLVTARSSAHVQALFGTDSHAEVLPTELVRALWSRLAFFAHAHIFQRTPRYHESSLQQQSSKSKRADLPCVHSSRSLSLSCLAGEQQLRPTVPAPSATKWCTKPLPRRQRS